MESLGYAWDTERGERFGGLPRGSGMLVCWVESRIGEQWQGENGSQGQLDMDRVGALLA